MSATAAVPSPRRRFSRLRVAAGPLAIAALAAVAGAGLVRFAMFFGDWAPLAAIVAAAIPLIVVAILSNPLLGALLVFLTFPFGTTGVAVGGIKLQAAEGAVMFVATVIALRRLAAGRSPFPWVWPLFWALAMGAWMLVSFYGALSHSLAAKALISFAGAVVFACIIVAVADNFADLRWILGAFVFAAAIIAAIGLSSGSGVETASGSGDVVSGRLSTAFSSPNQLGTLCAMAFPVATALMLASRRLAARVLAGAILLLVLSSLGLSLSRGAWLGAGVAFLFMLVTIREARRLVALVGVPLAIVGIVIYVYARPSTPEIKVINERAQAFTQLSPYDSRNDVWREALREAKAHPMVGEGPGSFPVASARAGSEASTVQAEHAHNLWLNTAAEQGFPADAWLAAFIVALGIVGFRISARTRRLGALNERALAMGVAAALIALLAQEMLDHTLTNPVVRIAAWGLIGCLLAAERVTARSGA
jgi:putative inorganic carbon (HCO3(-)) transporter